MSCSYESSYYESESSYYDSSYYESESSDSGNSINIHIYVHSTSDYSDSSDYSYQPSADYSDDYDSDEDTRRPCRHQPSRKSRRSKRPVPSSVASCP